MNSHETNDDLMMFTMDPELSDLTTSDYQSFETSHQPLDFSNPLMKTKMFDITDLLGSSTFDDQEHWFDQLEPISRSSPSLDVGEYLRLQASTLSRDSNDKSQWQIEQNRLKYDAQQISPSDFLPRPVAFEKESRPWTRNLSETFKKNHPAQGSPSIDPQQIDEQNETNRSQLFYTLSDSLDIIDALLGTVISSF